MYFPEICFSMLLKIFIFLTSVLWISSPSLKLLLLYLFKIIIWICFLLIFLQGQIRYFLKLFFWILFKHILEKGIVLNFHGVVFCLRWEIPHDQSNLLKGLFVYWLQELDCLGFSLRFQSLFLQWISQWATNLNICCFTQWRNM